MRVRIHVERAIGALKERFQILQGPVGLRQNNQFKNRPTSLLEGDFTSPGGPMEASTPMDDSIYMDSFFRTDDSIYVDSFVRIYESIYVMDVDASTLPSSMYVDSDSGEPPQAEGMDASTQVSVSPLSTTDVSSA
ncbi:Uncharacterized protein APZ42_033687 [Daphnia magna]|uniref:Uncharacterized protein n=1 Tax=Daphnia magna TaxID=35525 RepID=A0A164KR41_9CRUS|nr:Uncharacterized protein APZ42_033687 [Daphnia magna]